MDFLSRLFDTSDFPARWNCGNWSPGLGWLHILSDLGVWSAYLAIPCVLAYFVLQKKDLPFRKIFLLFVGFILFCGTTHLMEAIIFWWPAYRLAAVIKLATAVISWATVAALIPIVPRVLAMRSPEELEREVAARQNAEATLQRLNTELEQRVAARTAELFEERELLRVTLQSIGDAVVTTDTRGRVTFLNEVARKLMGWTSEEARGRSLGEIFHIVNENTRQPVENPVDRALREGRVVGLANHTILIGRTEGETPIEDSAAPIRDESGHVSGVILIFRDVSEQKAAEKIVREGEAQFRTLADAIPQLAWMARADGFIHWYNRRWYEFTGTTPEQMEGWGWQSVHDPEMLPRVMERWMASIASGDPFEMIFPLRRADGAFHSFLTRVQPIKDSRGRVTQWFGTNTDVEELRQLASELSDADRRKDEFLATLAHELRNPLAPIRNALHMMRESGADRSVFIGVRDMMERQLGQMVRLVDDLLDVSRITRGKIELRLEILTVSSVLELALETSRPLIEAGNHGLSVETGPEPIWVRGDRTRLAQIVANLLNNAAKYTPDRGLIRLSAELVDGQAIISVRDNGMGIPAPMLTKIFEMFAQVDKTVEHAQGGLGIGLTLVRRLTEMHDGTIEARSEGAGMGSEFIVRLNAVDSPDSTERIDHAPSAATPSHSISRRVLVVDDNLDSAESLGMLLQILGNDVRTAHDGPSAIQMALEHRPEIVMLDIGLPGMNGYEVARSMRGMPEFQDTVLIAQTGWGQEDDRRRSAESGFDAHLVKPVDLADLKAIISKLARKAVAPIDARK